MNQQLLDFDGVTYLRESDFERLTTQLEKVRWLMAAGGWWTLAELRSKIPEASETGLSARIRDLRKDKFGGYAVESRRRNESGLWEYRAIKVQPCE